MCAGRGPNCFFFFLFPPSVWLMSLVHFSHCFAYLTQFVHIYESVLTYNVSKMCAATVDTMVRVTFKFV